MSLFASFYCQEYWHFSDCRNFSLEHHWCDMQLLTRSEICEKLSVSAATLDRMRNRDQSFPEPIHLTSRALRWDVRDIEEWVETKKRRYEAPTLSGYRPEFMPRGNRRPPNARKKTG